MLLKDMYLGETCPHQDMEIWSFFLNGWELVKLGLDSDNLLAWELGVVMKSHIIWKEHQKF